MEFQRGQLVRLKLDSRWSYWRQEETFICLDRVVPDTRTRRRRNLLCQDGQTMMVNEKYLEAIDDV